MNCWRGICKYKEDNTELCLKDTDEGKETNKCDIHKDALGSHLCRYGVVGCQDCYHYDTCDIT